MLARLLMELAHGREGTGRAAPFGVAAALTGAFALADLSTPSDLTFTAFYLLPVMLASWSCGVGGGAALAVAASLAPTYQLLSAEPPDAAGVVAWNALSRLVVMLIVCKLVATLSTLLAGARQLSELDHLTQVANRRHFEAVAEDELRRSQRHGNGLTLLLLDLDDFKRLNDRHGHSAGDAALRTVARELTRVVRGGDLVARLGGDEFVVLLPGLGPDRAPVVVAELRTRLERALAAHEHPLRASIGATSYREVPATLAQALEEADRAMYVAKADRDPLPATA